MARVSDNVLPDGSQLGLTLDRYQEVIGLNNCAFNGINRPTDNHDTSCIDIVNQSQRDQLAIYLLQAEQMREEELGYHVWPKYVWYEEHDITQGNPFSLDRKYLINIGCPTYTLVEAGVAIDLGTPDDNLNDPVEITVTTTAARNEIAVMYPGEYVRISPSRVVVSGGTATIRIPRCRLVKPEYNDDWDDPPSYYDNDVFLDSVDVYRYHSDVAEGARFVWRQAPCDVDCEPNYQVACGIITGKMAYDLSIVHFYPAARSDGAWVTARCFTYATMPTSVQVTYLSGKYNLSNQIFTIRLAHTLMPRPPCACDIVKQKWVDDRTIPEDGGWSPYGNMIGAIHTWMADSRAMVGHGGMFPRPGGLDS